MSTQEPKGAPQVRSESDESALDEGQATRGKEFTRRALLAAGWAVPVILVVQGTCATAAAAVSGRSSGRDLRYPPGLRRDRPRRRKGRRRTPKRKRVIRTTEKNRSNKKTEEKKSKKKAEKRNTRP